MARRCRPCHLTRSQPRSEKDDKMFGSVTAKDIAEGLAEQGFTVDRRKIQLAQPSRNWNPRDCREAPARSDRHDRGPRGQRNRKNGSSRPRPNLWRDDAWPPDRRHVRRKHAGSDRIIGRVEIDRPETYDAIVAEEQRQRDKVAADRLGKILRVPPFWPLRAA